jgi:hypothetical protein
MRGARLSERESVCVCVVVMMRKMWKGIMSKKERE